MIPHKTHFIRKRIARNCNIEDVLATQIKEDIFSLGSGILNVIYKLVILKVDFFFWLKIFEYLAFCLL